MNPLLQTSIAALCLGALGLAQGARAQSQAPLAPTNGYDSNQGKTLVQAGELSLVTASDSSRLGMPGGTFASFQFAPNVPAGSTIISAVATIQHYEDAGMAANKIVFQAAGGSASSPTPVYSSQKPAIVAATSEATITWDLSASINTPALVNGLVLAVQNNAAAGKKVWINFVSLQLVYQGPLSGPYSTYVILPTVSGVTQVTPMGLNSASPLKVVGWGRDALGNDTSVLWQGTNPSAMTASKLGCVTNQACVIEGISNTGVSVGAGIDPNGYGGAVRWDASNHPASLQSLDANFYATAEGINNAGLAVGSGPVVGQSNNRGVRWDTSTLAATMLPPPAGYAGWEYALAINNASPPQSVGYDTQWPPTSNGYPDVAILWTGLAPTILPPLPTGSAALAYGINDVGDVAGFGDGSGQTQAIVWSGGAPIQLPGLAGSNAHFAFGINAASTAVGRGQYTGAAWQKPYSAAIPLKQPQGMTFCSAVKINDNGIIAGHCRDATMTEHSMLWLP